MWHGKGEKERPTLLLSFFLYLLFLQPAGSLRLRDKEPCKKE